MKNILSPSILSADFWKLGEQIEEVEKAGAKYLHIDVMDGMFVPSLSFAMPVIASVRKHTQMFLDVHLMIEKPERYIKEFAQSGADLINFHLEATKDPCGVIKAIREQNKKVGITINPGTPAIELKPYLHLVDMVLIMTVNPGFGGQKLIDDCVDKITQIRKMAKELNLDLDIEADGGINADNVDTIVKAGANVIVAGSAIFKNDITGNVKNFLEKMHE